MAKITGYAVRFYVDISGTATLIGGETGCSLNLRTNVVDSTCKDDSSNRTLLASIAEWSMSGNAKNNEGNAGIEKLITNMTSRASGTVQIKTYNSKIFSGTGFYTDVTLDFPYDDNSTVSFQVEGSGALTYSA